ncbi:MAG: 3-isopropylmalate dehydratase large subunit [Deltaproteobacteria bacterium]|nr:3-isopropylmalate dehydratase large subunit [Deltaproteobacteria bacterium]
MKPEQKNDSLFEKLWAGHVIEHLGDDMDLIYIDRHLLHDLSGPASLGQLIEKGLPLHSKAQTYAVPDHSVSTEPGRTADSTEVSKQLLIPLRNYCRELGIRLFDLNNEEQGIVHVIGPELGLTLPGCSIACGDSHTCTHGAFGALAWGIGSTEITQVLATQALIVEKPLSMRVLFRGRPPRETSPKDLILYLIGKHGAKGGTRHAVEFAGETIETMSLDGRLTVCNLAVEFGAKFGFIAPDEKTYQYLKERPYAPKGRSWEKAVEAWRRLPSGLSAGFDREITIEATMVKPQITWGTSPEEVIPVDGRIPSLREAPDEKTAEAWKKSLAYMGLSGGSPIEGLPIEHVFIGACTNGRLSDLTAAAELVKGRKVAAKVRAWVVPGSKAVKREAEAKQLDRIFKEAGFEWREPGCSLCLGMNGELIPSGERCVSTSNRNFVGRQGPGARTHLASPRTAAAAAIAGKIISASELGG